MSDKQSHEAPMHDDLDAYIATFDEHERQELAQAEAALDLAVLLHEVRTARGLTQKDAAARAGLQQQAISRWERAHTSVQLGTLRRYLDALGYTLDLVIRDKETGEVVSTAPSAQAPAGAVTVAPQTHPDVAARYLDPFEFGYAELTFEWRDKAPRSSWQDLLGSGRPTFHAYLDKFLTANVTYSAVSAGPPVEPSEYLQPFLLGRFAPQVTSSEVLGPWLLSGAYRSCCHVHQFRSLQRGNAQVPSQEKRPRTPEKVA